MFRRAYRETVNTYGARPTMTNNTECTLWPRKHNAMTS